MNNHEWNDCIFETFVLQFAVQKCLYLGGFWSNFEFLKTHMSPHVSWACPAMSWTWPGHVLDMFKSCQRHPATRFWCIFFQFSSIFFTFFKKNHVFFCKIHITPPCSDLFISISYIIFHILAIKRHHRLAPREILTLPFMTEIWHKNVSRYPRNSNLWTLKA